MRLRASRAASLALIAVLLAGSSAFAPLYAQSVARPAGGDYIAQPHSGPRSVTRAAGASSPTTPAGSRGITAPAGSATAGTQDQRPSAAPPSAFRAVQRNAFGTPLEVPAPPPSRRPADAVANSAHPRPAYTRPHGSGPSDPVPQQTEPAGSGDFQVWPEAGELGTAPGAPASPTGAAARDTTREWGPPGAGDAQRFEPFGMRSLDYDARQTRPSSSTGASESTGESSGQRWADPGYARTTTRRSRSRRTRPPGRITGSTTPIEDRKTPVK